ncbi:type VII secretion target [Nocardia aobensis]|uniref:type VII secretion target n=1 Tax=Nocardia aobensis TaxID=257277 RepID=UPI0003074504|nr:type VII secretion target [Nocardia aobensis]
MSGSMEVDPAVLLDLALQHDRVAEDTLEWAKPPTDWLREFPNTYGHIADPVLGALQDYYQARQNAGIALAKEHRDTAAKLRAAAAAFERSDEDGAANIRRYDDTNGSGSTPYQQSPSLPGPGTQAPTGPQVGAPGSGPADAGAHTPGDTGADTPVGVAPGAAPGTSSAAPDSTGATPGTAPVGAGTGTGTGTGPSAAGGPAGPGGGPAGPPSGPLGTTPPSGVVPPGGPAGPPSGFGPDERGQGPNGTTAAGDLPPVPVPTPFAAAVAKAKDAEAEPAYVVGDAVDNDLLIARTLLGAVLAAVDSSVLGLHWAVAVLRGPAGAGVFITSNEGRGWFPAGLYLPREVSSPWIWDDVLADGSGDPASPWEGVSDPARVLAEFGLAWGRKAGAELTALVSSGSIDHGLRQRFPSVAMQDLVGPSYDVDLRVFTPDTADRLALAGSGEALEHVAAVPDAQIRAHCEELAAEAHRLVAGSAPGGPDAAQSRGIRDRILSALGSGRPIPASWWEELRDADDLLTAAMLPHRVDVGRVDVGELRVDDEAAALRALVFERRCNELVLLLAGEASRQQLRDAVYAHEQIVKHPRFVPAPAAVSTGVDERVSRPAASSGSVAAPVAQVAPPTVSAPPTAGGPPPGAVSAPDASAPDVTGRP